MSLERLLLEKNKKMENENISLKMECRSLNAKIEELVDQQKKIDFEINTKSALISRLESDILLMKNVNSPTEYLSSLISDLDAENKDSSSIIPILTAQRDRYKLRFEQTQKTLTETRSDVSTLQYKLKKLEVDNVSLYEKLRFQENYVYSVLFFN
jgi:homeobox protein cut-like